MKRKVQEQKQASDAPEGAELLCDRVNYSLQCRSEWFTPWIWKYFLVWMKIKLRTFNVCLDYQRRYWPSPLTLLRCIIRFWSYNENFWMGLRFAFFFSFFFFFITAGVKGKFWSVMANNLFCPEVSLFMPRWCGWKYLVKKSQTTGNGSKVNRESPSSAVS